MLLRNGSIPEFTYHPDPVATGSVEADDGPCAVCGVAAGFRYLGPIYGKQADVLCLRCMHSGRAAEALGISPEHPAMFTDIDHDGSWFEVPAETVEEILHRTPGFRGWQQERWLAHCDDACTFLGLAGWNELQEAGDEAITAIREEMAAYGWTPQQADEYLRSLNTRGASTAYLFRCRACERYRAYSDMN